MLKHLKLENFKNFKSAELSLGNFTVLVGTNASGKSNLRDAFRFLHGIGRGYTLADIIGGKWGEGGEQQWGGIRGGAREATFRPSATFALEVELMAFGDYHGPFARYRIEVNPGTYGSPPRVLAESLYYRKGTIFDSHPKDNPPNQADDPQHILVRLTNDKSSKAHGKVLQFRSSQPVLTQISESEKVSVNYKRDAVAAQVRLLDVRFHDLAPYAMRIPSLPGQTILGDRGENLSSVLQAICEEPERKKALLEWVKELTPLDAADFKFVADQTGRILVSLVEGNGQEISAYSASDGTLKFLGVIAALMGPKPNRLYFFEELENGIHPTRLHLLLQLIEQKTSEKEIRVVASTHSPQLLGMLAPSSIENASLVYRLPDSQDAKIKRIMDIPEARRLVEEKKVARLMESGWLERAVYFTAPAETPGRG